MNEPADPRRPRSPQRHAGPTDSASPADGDDAARGIEFTRFYRETTKPLVAFLILQGATLTEATDLAQDTMTKAFQRWHTIDHPYAWTCRVASRAFIRLRVEQPETPMDPLPNPPLLRGGVVEGWELLLDLVRALAQLTPRQRQIMAWTLAGHNPSEIAAELDLPAKTVRQHLYLGRQTLSATLTGKETQP